MVEVGVAGARMSLPPGRREGSGEARSRTVRYKSFDFSWSAGGAVAGRGRHVQGGVAVEEPGRLEHEAAAGDRHDGPVLRPRDMGGAERVPEDDVGAVDVAVAGDEG